MSLPPTVAIVRSDNRRGAVAAALALIADQVAVPLPGPAVLLPDFGSAHDPRAWTQPETLSATLDALLAWGPAGALVLVPDAAVLDRSNYRGETFGRPVEYRLDPLPNEANAWTRWELDLGDGQPVGVRVNAILDHRPSFVAVATMKTAGASTVAFALANALSLVHPADRALVDLDWRRCTERSSAGSLEHFFAQLRGRWVGRYRRLFPAAAIEHLHQSERLSRLIAGLAAVARPAVSLVDGFVALEGDGPHHGSFRKRGVVVAGTDPVAVDSVAAWIMGFDPAAVGHLRDAHALGLGVIDPETIRLVGDSIASVQKPCVPHFRQATRQPVDRLVVPRPVAQSGPKGATPHARPDRSRTRL